MKEDLRKKRIEIILKKHFSPKVLLVRDDSKKHEGHTQVSRKAKETHFFIKMVLNNCNISKLFGTLNKSLSIPFFPINTPLISTPIFILRDVVSHVRDIDNITQTLKNIFNY